MSDPKEDFLNPQPSYHGNLTAANIAFNANLQEFSNKVVLICSLESSGKLSPHNAYKQIKALWKDLKLSKREILDHPDLQGTAPEDPPEQEW